MSEWREYPLKVLGNVITGKTPSNDNPEDWGSEMPFVTPTDYNTYRKYAFSSTRNLSDAGIKKLKNKVLPLGSVLVTCIGSDMGKVVMNKAEVITNQQINSIIPDTAIVDGDFLYYGLIDMYDILRTYGGDGTAVPIVNKGDFENLQTSLPDIPEQKAIASVLACLDDKIDLLHRQNKTLEAIAETLFRQWFVEEAQEDWEEEKLGDFFPVITGKKDANFGTDDGEYPFFTCSQLPIKAPDYSFDGAAILLAGNGDFNVKRYIGKFEAYQRTYVLIPYETKYLSFLYTLMKYLLPDITGGHQGSVINFITKGMITEFRFSLPVDRNLISEKLNQFTGIYEKVDSNAQQIHTLQKLRDTLLPKLMSGEVRVTI